MSDQPLDLSIMGCRKRPLEHPVSVVTPLPSRLTNASRIQPPVASTIKSQPKAPNAGVPKPTLPVSTPVYNVPYLNTSLPTTSAPLFNQQFPTSYFDSTLQGLAALPQLPLGLLQNSDLQTLSISHALYRQQVQAAAMWAKCRKFYINHICF